MPEPTKAAYSSRSQAPRAIRDRKQIAPRSVDGSSAPVRPRTERRVLRTRKAIEDAFVELVLESGYDRVSVEDITDRADVAKGTFYAHYENKEALVNAVFARVTSDLAERVAHSDGPWAEVRFAAVRTLYEHASEMRDLYQVCLNDPRTRTSYLDAFTGYIEQNTQARLDALGKEPRIPVRVTARAFAGAQVALLQAWLDGEIDATPEQMAAMQLDMLVEGMAWAQNVSLSEEGTRAVNRKRHSSRANRTSQQ
jgi:AcrR family transcriptional regulator